jgi:hypothetical protein
MACKSRKGAPVRQSILAGLLDSSLQQGKLCPPDEAALYEFSAILRNIGGSTDGEAFLIVS